MPPDTRVLKLLNRGQRRSYLPPIATYPSVGWLLVGLLIPVSVFFLFSFWETGVFTLIRTWSLDQYREVVTDDLYYGLILRTLLLALTVSAAVLPVAYLGAYVLRFIISRGRRGILFLIVASALASYLVRIYAWKAILTPAGILNSALDSLGLISEPLTLLGRPGVIIALTHILVPIAMLPIAGAMESVNPDLIRASRDLGAGPVETFLRVTLPLTARGVVTAFVLTFVLAAGDYVTPQLVGGKGSLMIGRVIFDQFGITGNYALASALSFSLIVAAAAFIVGVLLCVRVLAGGARRLGAVATDVRARRLRVAWPVWVRRLPWGHTYLLLLLLFLWVPLILVLILSFNQLPIASLPITGWTLDWYREIFTDQTIRGAFGTSLKVAGLVVRDRVGDRTPDRVRGQPPNVRDQARSHGSSRSPDRPSRGRRGLLDSGDVPIPRADPVDTIHRARTGDTHPPVRRPDRDGGASELRQKHRGRRTRSRVHVLGCPATGDAADPAPHHRRNRADRLCDLDGRVRGDQLHRRNRPDAATGHLEHHEPPRDTTDRERGGIHPHGRATHRGDRVHGVDTSDPEEA